MNPNRDPAATSSRHQARSAFLAAAVACLCLVAACGSDASGKQSPSTNTSTPSSQDGANGGTGGSGGGPGAKPGSGGKGGAHPGTEATVPPDVGGGEAGPK